MKKIVSKMLIIGAATIGSINFLPQARAQMVVVDPVNLVENVVLVQQKIQELQSMAQQIQMYEKQIRSWSFSDIFNTLKRMGSLGDQIGLNQEKLKESLQSLPEEWKSVDLGQLQKFKEERLEANRDRTKDLLKAQETVAENASKVKTQVEKYIAKSNVASGAVAAIQAGNEMLATTISQLQDMQSLEIANLQKDIETIAEKQSKEAWDQAYGKINAKAQEMLTGE